MPEKEFVVNYIVRREEEAASQAASVAGYKKIGDAADQAAKKAGKAADDEASKRKKAVAEVLTAEQAAAKAGEELIRRRNQTVIRSLADQGDAAKQSAAKMASMNAAGSKFVGILGGIGSATFGISGVVGVIDAVTQSFARAKAESIAAGKEASSYRDKLKEIAFLRGSTSGPNASIVKADLDFRSNTLQDASNSRITQESFFNQAAISIDSPSTRAKMTKEDAEKAMIHAGRMNSQFGGEGSAFGELGGVLASMERSPRVTGEDLIRRMTQMNAIGQLGAADASPFAGAMARASSLVTSGSIRDPGRLAAVGSALSFGAKGDISTALEQFHKATGGAILNKEKPMGSTMSPADYMKGIGANDQMDDIDILKKMFADMEKAEVARKAKGEEFRVDTYLKERGYGDQREMGQIKNLYGRRNDFNTMLKMADKLPTLEEAQSPFEQFRASVQGQKQASDVSVEQARVGTGMGAQEYYQRMEQQAYAAMKHSGEATGSLDDMKGGYFGSRQLQGKMVEMLRQEGTAKGLDWETKTFNTRTGQHVIDPLSDLSSGIFGSPGNQSSAEAFHKRGLEISGKGGSMMGENSQISKDSLKTSKELLESNVRVEQLLGSINSKVAPPVVSTVVPGGKNAGRTR